MLDLSKIRESLRYEGGVSRRFFLGYSAALSAIPLLGRECRAGGKPHFSDNPFTLGVVSGDPDSTSVVLWTRLAPQPLQADGGMPPEAVAVHWQIAEDESMQKVVAKGTAIATPQLGHSVHVEARGLKPDRWYWYRFQSGDAESPIGRTRTLPAPHVMPEQLKFAFASCQHYEYGYFTAYKQMAEDDLDLVFHLGDYIYEYGATDNRPRQHHGPEVQSLGDYRTRLSQYRADPLLQKMHHLCPWFVTWDDHELDNNCAGDISEEKHVSPADFLIRRANAYQAYYEMMPLRARSLPRGPYLQLYRRASFGRLAEFMVLDTRQYRTDQPNDERKSPLNADALNPKNSLLGDAQRNWLCRSLIGSQATWNVLAQQVMMGMVGFGEPAEYSMDQWPGYTHERMQLMRFIAERRVPNPVVLTGDIHSHWVNNLRVDDRNENEPVVATEFVGSSITSGGKGKDATEEMQKLQSTNPCVQFLNRQRGYVRCKVTPTEWASDYLVVDDVTIPEGKVSKVISFAVEAGKPGAERA